MEGSDPVEDLPEALTAAGVQNDLSKLYPRFLAPGLEVVLTDIVTTVSSIGEALKVLVVEVHVQLVLHLYQVLWLFLLDRVDALLGPAVFLDIAAL